MFSIRLFIISLFALLSGIIPALAGATKPPKPAPRFSYEQSIVRVSSTNQAFDFNTPWKKQTPYTRRGIGTIVEGGYILVTSDLVANHNYVELENSTGAKRCPATVFLVDYDGNIALLKPSDPDFLKDSKPLSLDVNAKLGDSSDILQLERNGSVVFTPANITSVIVGPYPQDEVSMLLFRVSLSLQYRDNSFVLPAVHDGKLIGLLMRYDVRTQYADLIPSPIIAHFLKAAATTPYKSFPRAEMGFSSLRDPQLRKYLGLGKDLANQGVYVSNIITGGPADKAGIKQGDVVLAVGGKTLDADGNYNHPVYGLIPFSNITNNEAVAGQEIPFTVYRDGKTQDISVKVEPRDIGKMISEPYSMDKAPPYYILGGLVFQELSRDYLREWGKNWQREAPQKLLYYDHYQQELFPSGGGKIVILNQVLSNEAAYGYDALSNLIVKNVNDCPVKSLTDLVDALKYPINGYYKIEFEDDPGVIYLDPSLIERLKDKIKEQYNLPSLENLAGETGK
ncbi:MAG: PDZ domain-containing protein [Chthoniobacterales bacterium]